MADTPEEKAHWRSVIKAYDGYMQYHLSANHSRRMAFLALPKESRVILEEIGYKEKLEAVDEGIRRNAEFLEEMIADPVFSEMLQEDQTPAGLGHEHDHSHTHQHNGEPDHTHASSTPRGESSSRESTRHSAQDKVRSTLRSFVRDWSEAGAAEREACYTPCLEALERHLPYQGNNTSSSGTEESHGDSETKGKKRDRGNVNVLVPGCGLGRLAMEIAARGFASQGNEFSTYMLLASHWVLNQSTHANSHTIHPYLHSFSNHLSTDNLLRGVLIPDVCPAEVLGGGQGGAFSLVAGDFEEIYGKDEAGEEGQKGKWAAVVTCFFIDCARNILRFLRIIYDLLEEDGIWVNIGPLLWHFENSPTSSSNGEGSIELSLDEVKALARQVGFDIQDERMVKTTYTGMPDTMLKHEYQAAFWTATKRAGPLHS